MTTLDRRAFLSTATAAALAQQAQATTAPPSGRPPIAERKFRSPAVEAEIVRIRGLVAEPKLARLFENCFPNTLDTTTTVAALPDGSPDTMVITGDIAAMWLRDSSCQVRPYLHLAGRDPALTRLFRGLIGRQARSILIDPYANAFMPDPSARTNLSWALHDETDMKPGVAERKWEVDSLLHPMRLHHDYWRATGDVAAFDATWRRAMRLAVATLREQQRLHGPGPYRFLRPTDRAVDTLTMDGYGAPTRKIGLIHSMFRPSDDACVLPFLIPSNVFAVSGLRQMAAVAEHAASDAALASDGRALAAQVESALARHGRMQDGADGRILAYEIDGYGNALFMDDANIPSLSSLAYLGARRRDDPLFRRTAAAAWSGRNPYFFRGRAAEGIGGPHVGAGQVWPMSIVVRALTSQDDAEIAAALRTLATTDAGTGFMHESFDADDPEKFTRPWFAWANSLFAELILQLAAQRPALLARFRL